MAPSPSSQDAPTGTSGPSRGRPPTTTPSAIERESFRVLSTRSYDEVTVSELAARAGVSRATFFRYFPTKASVVWWGFDRAIDQLEASLEASLGDVGVEADTFVVLRAAIADSVRAGVDEHGVWWDRFVLLDSVPSLRGEAAQRWDRWQAVVSGYVAERAGLAGTHPLAAAIAGAHQSAYLATLRGWPGRPGDPERMLAEMMATLEKLGDSLRDLI